MFSVYTLSDPRTSHIRYVGISCNVERRYLAHCTSDPCNASKRSWIQELRDSQLTPTLAVIETELTFEDAKAHELNWIQYYLEQGMPLFNISGVSKPWTGGIYTRKKIKPAPKPELTSYLLVEEVAFRLGIPADVVTKKLENSEMPGYLVVRRWLVDAVELEEYVKTHP